MALDVSTISAFRSVADREDLVRAVARAHRKGDETDWVEWKQLDLALDDGIFKIARAILSFANRLPDEAAPFCDGHAYIVIGAGEGKIDGIERLDGQDLEKKINTYVGRKPGPRWRHDYVELRPESKDVLVITVEPPRQGDRIWTLRKGAPHQPIGTVLVRHKASSEPALQADIDALALRATPPVQEQTPQLSVIVSAGPLIAVDIEEQAKDEWIDARRSALGSVRPPDLVAGIIGYTHRGDDALEDEIEQYLEDCRSILLGASVFEVSNYESNVVSFTVTNNSEDYYDGVAIDFTLPGPVYVFDYAKVAKWELPPVPAMWKPQKSFAAQFAGIASPLDLSRIMTPNIRTSLSEYLLTPGLVVSEDREDFSLEFGGIGPGKSIPSRPVVLVPMNIDGIDNPLTIHWSAWARNTKGSQVGRCLLPLAEENPGPLSIVSHVGAQPHSTGRHDVPLDGDTVRWATEPLG